MQTPRVRRELMMKRNWIRIGLMVMPVIGVAMLRADMPPGAPPDRVSVVVELFTSEGCSSCPPADQVLAALADKGARRRSSLRNRFRSVAPIPENVDLILLGEHVDYWDNLGWKDRFSSRLYSSRQQSYGRAFHSGSVYTPQAVIQGAKEVLGSDISALGLAIRGAADAAIKSGQAEVAIEKKNMDTVKLRVGTLPKGSHKADVMLAVTESDLETSVAAGENDGRRLRHTAVVRSMNRLAELDPKNPGVYFAEAQLNLKPEWNRLHLKLILLVQDRETQQILGAAQLAL